MRKPRRQHRRSRAGVIVVNVVSVVVVVTSVAGTVKMAQQKRKIRKKKVEHKAKEAKIERKLAANCKKAEVTPSPKRPQAEAEAEAEAAGRRKRKAHTTMKVNAREAKSIDVRVCLCVCLVRVCVCVCLWHCCCRCAFAQHFATLGCSSPGTRPQSNPLCPGSPRCHCHCLCHCLGCLCCSTRLRHIDFLRGSHVLGASHEGRQAELSVSIGVRVCVFAKGEAQLWAQLFLVAPFPLQRNVNEPRRSKAAAAAAMIISGIISNFR